MNIFKKFIREPSDEKDDLLEGFDKFEFDEFTFDEFTLESEEN